MPTASATSSDGESSIQKLNFPAVSGMTGGGDVLSPGPYSSGYTWTATTAASGAQTVTATNNAGVTASSAFTVTKDTAGPTPNVPSVTAGYYGTASVAVTVAPLFTSAPAAGALSEKAAGGVESAAIVIVAEAVEPAPFVATIDFAPGAEAPAVHVYVAGDAYGLVVSAPPVEPVQPVVAETSGNATCVTVDSASLAVAASVNEPEAAGLK